MESLLKEEGGVGKAEWMPCWTAPARQVARSRGNRNYGREASLACIEGDLTFIPIMTSGGETEAHGELLRILNGSSPLIRSSSLWL